MSFDKIFTYIIIIAIIIAAGSTVYILISPAKGEKFTEFYILGADGKAGNYPTNLTLGSTANLTIGVVNHEDEATNYHLLVKLDGKILKDENITLPDDGRKEIPLTFEASSAGQNQSLEFLLYKLPDDNNVYRSLYLLINVS
jgi:uncharacterized membrane protein